PGHLAQDCPKSGGMGIEGDMRNPQPAPCPAWTSPALPSARGAQGGSQGSRASSLPEVEGDQARGPIVTVGRASIGDSCFIVVNVDVRLRVAEVTPGPKGSPNCTPTENPPAPSQLPGPQPGGDGVRLALKAIWTKNSGHLTASQQEQLWELLREFKDSFALGEEE
ncbi:hypothetical protein NHX12_033630, partial [Muraenolepis orangiensis]